VAVSVAVAAVFAWRNRGTFTVLSDPDRSDTGAAYPIANFPTHVLIDADGVVWDVVPAEFDEEEIVACAERVLGPAGGMMADVGLLTAFVAGAPSYPLHLPPPDDGDGRRGGCLTRLTE